MVKDYQTRIEEAAKLIAYSNHLIVFTGAGISTESGIPDFRGPNGVWTRRDKGLPPPKWRKPADQVRPNEGHKVIYELQEMGLMKYLISQNVDNLHLESGIRPEMIAELHGNGKLMRCLICEKQFPKQGLWDVKRWGKGYRTMKPKPGQPKCPECGGRIISSVVNFKDPLPERELNESYWHSQNADVFLVVGSSLSVTPAADLPIEAANNDAKIIIINKEDTYHDDIADIRFYEGAGETLIQILDLVKKFKNKI